MMSRPNSITGHTPRGYQVDTQGPSPPATLSTARPGTGYHFFASDLRKRLRDTTSFGPESIHSAVERRWKAMSKNERARYDAMAYENRFGPRTPASTASIPFNLHKDRLPSTPKPSPQQISLLSSSPVRNGSPNLGSGRVKPKCTWRGARPFAATPTPQASHAAVALPSSPPVLGQVSSSRLNAAPQPRGFPKIKAERHPRIKTEAPPQAPQAPQRGAKRKVVEFIDLTSDD